MKIRNISGFKKIVDHWFIGLLCLVAIVVGCSWFEVALDQVDVKVDGQNYSWRTLSSTVAQVLKEKKIAVRPGDIVTPGLSTQVNDGLEIQVTRAFSVRLQVAGQEKKVFTTSKTVSAILKQAGIALRKDDRIVPGLEQTVQPNQEIQVIRYTTEIVKLRSVIHPGIEYQNDPKLEVGNRKVVQQGQEGLVERRIKRVYQNGKIIRQYKIADRIVKPAVNTVVAIGSSGAPSKAANTLVTSRGSYRYIEAKTMVATAYSPGPESCGVYAAAGRTYTGKKAGFGLVAVDPRIIRLGTKLYIEGYGKAEAADVGSAIKGNRIDLCFETYREAVLFGKKKIRVYVLE